MNEKRNVLIESARIARGNIKALDDVKAEDLDALFIPGGFGAAKNINQWALKGPEGAINTQVKQLILNMIDAKKPVAGVCMGPTVIAKALEGSGIQAELTPGTTEEKSPYDIKGIADGMESIGAKSVMKTVREIAVDEKNKIVTAPCYNMEATISEVHKNVKMAVDKLVELASK
jgi:enhancing lycopene biosynthesis protein 2